jgi:hypothetical protein
MMLASNTISNIRPKKEIQFKLIELGGIEELVELIKNNWKV